MKITKEVHCSTVSEFLEKIDFRNELFGQNAQRGDWIYRGHSDVKYRLVPSVLRPGVRLKDICREAGGLGDWVLIDHSEIENIVLWAFETRTLKEFFELADSAGLPLPEDSQMLRRKFEREAPEGFIDTKIQPQADPLGAPMLWPDESLFSLMALAQHHGVPTRLLDWTKNAKIAAYFASLRPKHAPQSDRLCVWAFNLLYYQKLVRKRRFDVDSRGKRSPITVVHAPGAGNTNLHKQEGLFLLYRGFRPIFEHPDTRGMDVILESYLEETSGSPPDQPLFVCISLPRQESSKLLRALAADGFHPARLFSGFDGVSRALREQWEEWGQPISEPMMNFLRFVQEPKLLMQISEHFGDSYVQLLEPIAEARLVWLHPEPYDPGGPREVRCILSEKGKNIVREFGG